MHISRENYSVLSRETAIMLEEDKTYLEALYERQPWSESGTDFTGYLPLLTKQPPPPKK